MKPFHLTIAPTTEDFNKQPFFTHISEDEKTSILSHLESIRYTPTVPPPTEQPFDDSIYFDANSKTYVIYKVYIKPINNLISDTDWQPKYYNSWEEAYEDYSTGFNIGYSIYLEKLQIAAIYKEQSFNNVYELEHYIRADKESIIQIMNSRNMFGRNIDNKSIIVVLDMDNNVVDIRRPFIHEQWEYQLIDKNDDCHERFLLHVNTDNTEQEILQDVFDNHIYPHITRITNNELTGANMAFYTVPLQRFIYRNFWGILKGDSDQ